MQLTEKLRNAFRHKILGLPEFEPPVVRSLSELSGSSQQRCRLERGSLLLKSPECAGLMSSIEAELGIPEDEFAAYFVPLLARTAEFYQLLPASRLCHHYQPGGSLVHGLEACLYALMALSGSRIEAFLPSDLRATSSRRVELRRHTRMVIGLMAMAHDIGKLNTDLEIEVFAASGRNLSAGQPYDPAGLGGVFSLTLYEYVRDVLKEDPRSVTYSWRFKPERAVNGHDKEWPRAVDAILAAVKMPIPAEVRNAFLDPSSRHWKQVVELKCKSDQFSVEHFRPTEEERFAVGHSEVHPEAIGLVGVLHWLSVRGHLVELEEYRATLFLPNSVLARLLALLPDLDDFGPVPRRPTIPEATAKALRNRGFTTHYPQFADPRGELSRYKDAEGVFLNPTISAGIRHWPDVEDPQEIIDETDEAAVIHHRGPPDEQSAAPTNAIDYEDVTSLGDEVPLATSERPLDEPAPAQSDAPKTTTTLRPLASQFPEAILGVASVLQRLTAEQLDNQEICRTIDGVLYFEGTFIESILEDHGIVSFRAFRETSEREVSDRWRVIGDTVIEGLLCTERYSRALRDADSTDMLLLPMLDSDWEIRIPVAKRNHRPRRKPAAKNPSAPATVPTPAEPEVEDRKAPSASTNGRPDFSTAALCDALVEAGRESPNGLFVITNDSLRVPIGVVDQFTGHPQRRGDLIRALQQDGAFVKRSKKYFYLNPDSKEVGQCLVSLAIPR